MINRLLNYFKKKENKLSIKNSDFKNQIKSKKKSWEDTKFNFTLNDYSDEYSNNIDDDDPCADGCKYQGSDGTCWCAAGK